VEHRVQEEGTFLDGARPLAEGEPESLHEAFSPTRGPLDLDHQGIPVSDNQNHRRE